MSTPTPHAAAETLKTFAREEGFDLVGISRAAPTARPGEFRQWIADGKHGAMEYLERNLEDRLDVTRKFPWAKSILSVALAYWSNAGAPPSAPPENPTAKIARYAWGRDYHKVIESKLKRVEQKIRAALPAAPDSPLQIRAYCDTGPILERELAARAGLGWIGKHTLLIHPRHGSFFLLGELILSLDLAPDEPLGDHCGTCRRCIEACPTDAIAPYTVDATRCISYQTLENRDAIPQEFHPAMRDANFIVGCDICQDVCPFNRQPLPTREADFTPRTPAPAVGLNEVADWQEQDWDIQTRGRALRRTKLAMWKRNAAILRAEPSSPAPAAPAPDQNPPR